MNNNPESKKAFENCPQLTPVDIVELPVTGWIDPDCKVHFYDKPKETVIVPIDQIKDNVS